MQKNINLDSSIYSPEAVQKAAYKFIDRFAALVSEANGVISLEITFDDGHETESEKIIADFKKELLDQNLRLKIKAETEPIRNLILAYTFSKSGLQS